MSEDRRFTTSVEIDATPEAVWRAITDAEHLVRWFPLEARVEPREGGKLLVSWGGAWTWDQRIAIWQPGRRLRTVMERGAPHDVTGNALPVAPVELAIEWSLEARSGGTSLTLVHSGFGRGAEWDDEVDGISRGWPFELRGLKHYVERHFGEERRVAWAHRATPARRRAVWERLASELSGLDGAVAPGARYRIGFRDGASVEGTVAFWNDALDMAGSAPALGDGWFRVSTFTGGGQTGVDIWLSTWGLDEDAVTPWKERFEAALARVVA